MQADESITFFIHQLQNGDRAHVEDIWDHFFRRLLPLARKRLHHRVRRVHDEEDVVSQALEECFRKLEAGKVPPIADRDNLWALLAKITDRRALNANRDLLCAKQGGNDVRGESLFLSRSGSVASGLGNFEGREPTPLLANAMADELDRLMQMLSEDEQKVASGKMKGLTNLEISDEIERSLATVERRLNSIRRKWEGRNED